jgi:hypothetical protein
MTLTMEQFAQLMERSIKAAVSSARTEPGTQEATVTAADFPTTVVWRDPNPIQHPNSMSFSLLRRFPLVPEKKHILEIIQFKFKPADLHKLIPRPSASNPERGNIAFDPVTQTMKHSPLPAVKHYPNLDTLLVALNEYFNILTAHLVHLKSAEHVANFSIATRKYVTLLARWNGIYRWDAIVNYHLAFHETMIPMMQAGEFLGWELSDESLRLEFLAPFPRTSNSARDFPHGGSAQSSSGKRQGPPPSNSTEICTKWNEGRCGITCPNRRKHQCSACNSPSHTVGSGKCSSSTSKSAAAG